MAIQSILKKYQSYAEIALDNYLPQEESEPQHLHQAMRYSVMGGGKRIRPILVYAAGQTFDLDIKQLNAAACAVELIHVYSLIHDDLPAMDNDDLRRGKPTCHKAFDEATAILAGDALQALAFEILANDSNIVVSAQQRIQMIKRLSQASGSLGMAGGQAIDLAAVGQSLTLDQLKNMHRHKTGALIQVSMELGGLCHPNIDTSDLHALKNYADAIGLAFQIQDDILDIESDTETLGKPQGSDLERNKPTYPNLLGLAEAKQAAKDMMHLAIESLAGLDKKADMLREIAHYIVERNN